MSAHDLHVPILKVEHLVAIKCPFATALFNVLVWFTWGQVGAVEMLNVGEEGVPVGTLMKVLGKDSTLCKMEEGISTSITAMGKSLKAQSDQGTL